MYHTTIIPKVLVYEVTRAVYHEQYGPRGSTVYQRIVQSLSGASDLLYTGYMKLM